MDTINKYNNELLKQQNKTRKFIYEKLNNELDLLEKHFSDTPNNNHSKTSEEFNSVYEANLYDLEKEKQSEIIFESSEIVDEKSEVYKYKSNVSGNDVKKQKVTDNDVIDINPNLTIEDISNNEFDESKYFSSFVANETKEIEETVLEEITEEVFDQNTKFKKKNDIVFNSTTGEVILRQNNLPVLVKNNWSSKIKNKKIISIFLACIIPVIGLATFFAVINSSGSIPPVYDDSNNGSQDILIDESVITPMIDPNSTILIEGKTVTYNDEKFITMFVNGVVQDVEKYNECDGDLSIRYNAYPDSIDFALDFCDNETIYYNYYLNNQHTIQGIIN